MSSDGSWITTSLAQNREYRDAAENWIPADERRADQSVEKLSRHARQWDSQPIETLARRDTDPGYCRVPVGPTR